MSAKIEIVIPASKDIISRPRYKNSVTVVQWKQYIDGNYIDGNTTKNVHCHLSVACPENIRYAPLWGLDFSQDLEHFVARINTFEY